MNVVVDDRLIVNLDNKPLFAKRSTSGAWWAPIMEKAAAKFHGTYENLTRGKSF
jgi:hypothetical protein